MTERKWWLISIGGYGEFGFFGTEIEAEEIRVNKANWEGGIGLKRLISKNDPYAKKEREHTRWEKKNDYLMNERQLESIEEINDD